MAAFKSLLVLSLAVIYSSGQSAENDNKLTTRKYTYDLYESNYYLYSKICEEKQL